MLGHQRDRNWAPIDIGFESHLGFLVAGRDPSDVWERRINEPCRHQPCPYALVGFALLDSEDGARQAYRDRARLSDEVVARCDLRVYEVRVDHAPTLHPVAEWADAFLHDLCHGPAEGPGWSQFRYHKEADDVAVICCEDRPYLDVLVLRDRVGELVELVDIGALI